MAEQELKPMVVFSELADQPVVRDAKQFGSADQPWHQMFSPTVRREAAAHWEADERDDIKSGSSRTYKG